MKKVLFVFFMVLFVTCFAAAQASRGGTMYVAVKSVNLKSSTGFFARTLGKLDYGERVTVVQVSGNHLEVRSAVNSSVTGWTAASNLTPRQIIVSSSNTTSAGEIALAGKGFNQEVEQSYRNQQGELNYADVDKVEGISLNEDELKRFLEDGRLSMGE